MESQNYGARMKPTLRSLVDESGYRQDHIAKKMNVSEASLSRWLNGGAQLPVMQAKPLADALGSSIDTIVLAAARTWKLAKVA
jgi:transcriptional regulator with XRE-family HTH domain